VHLAALLTHKLEAWSAGRFAWYNSGGRRPLDVTATSPLYVSLTSHTAFAFPARTLLCPQLFRTSSLDISAGTGRRAVARNGSSATTGAIRLQLVLVLALAADVVVVRREHHHGDHHSRGHPRGVRAPRQLLRVRDQVPAPARGVVAPAAVAPARAGGRRRRLNRQAGRAVVRRPRRRAAGPGPAAHPHAPRRQVHCRLLRRRRRRWWRGAEDIRVGVRRVPERVRGARARPAVAQLLPRLPHRLHRHVAAGQRAVPLLPERRHAAGDPVGAARPGGGGGGPSHQQAPGRRARQRKHCDRGARGAREVVRQQPRDDDDDAPAPAAEAAAAAAAAAVQQGGGERRRRGHRHEEDGRGVRGAALAAVRLPGLLLRQAPLRVHPGAPRHAKASARPIRAFVIRGCHAMAVRACSQKEYPCCACGLCWLGCYTL
jgi:hypothetical protein